MTSGEDERGIRSDIPIKTPGELGEINPRLAAILNNPSELIQSIAEKLFTSVRRSLRLSIAQGEGSAFLSDLENEGVACLAYLTANARSIVDEEAVARLNSLNSSVGATAGYLWVDGLGPSFALDLARSVEGPGLTVLYANLNHHRAIYREQVTNLAWLARTRLNPLMMAERVLFNVGASHGFTDSSLAVLRAACRDSEHFWSCIEGVMPDFANTGKYGRSLDSPWPERREKKLHDQLELLRNPESALFTSVMNPRYLINFERKVIEALLSDRWVEAHHTRLPL